MNTHIDCAIYLRIGKRVDVWRGVGVDDVATCIETMRGPCTTSSTHAFESFDSIVSISEECVFCILYCRNCDYLACIDQRDNYEQERGEGNKFIFIHYIFRNLRTTIVTRCAFETEIMNKDIKKQHLLHPASSFTWPSNGATWKTIRCEFDFDFYYHYFNYPFETDGCFWSVFAKVHIDLLDILMKWMRNENYWRFFQRTRS